ncbi:MAG: hypothetical protein E3J77_00985 [Actinobacteria bacterium]|nr:MAG: hypothetical protein E3J77_00985 [Actinomycetota bacterium]
MQKLKERNTYTIRMLTGEKLSASVKYSQLKLLESAKTLLIERRMALLPSLTERVSEPCF